MKRVLAIDFGASSGRAIVGNFDGETITLEEIHRFSNDPVIVGDTMYWDVLRLYYEIKQSLVKAKGYDISSIGIDTWGVDFGLIDKNGRLLENPVHYRDSRTKGMLKKAFELTDKANFYSKTGNQFMEINTAFQLLSITLNRPELMEKADKMLMMPDLFGYFLTGEKITELSMASTTQLYNQTDKCWAKDIAQKLSIKTDILAPIHQAGTKLGKILPQICEELDIEPVDVISVCGHDTQCAMVAVPATEKDFAFLSCGTWSLLGTELDSPLLDENAMRLNVTNEVGYNGKTSFLKNIIGLWLIQESRRQWQREGKDYSFAQLEDMAKQAKPMVSFINPDAEEFVPSGNIPKRIREFCKNTKQPVPQSDGEVMRCIYESLALKYRVSVEELSACTGKSYPVIYMIGGGTKDRFLSELTANACKCTVCSGPVEATAFGNIAVQLIADGDIKDIDEARKIIRRSEKLYTFTGEKPDEWDNAYCRYRKILNL